MSKPAASQQSKSNESHPSRSTALRQALPPAQTPPGLASPYDDILALQQSAGNRAVSELLQFGKEDHSLPTKGIPPVVQSVLNRNSGQPLDSVTRGSMEARFGQDFSQVRIHTDSQAAMSAQAVDADAYTVGSHIAFDQDQYRPRTEEGKSLLSHELSHVIEQQVTAPKVQLEKKRKKRKKQKDPKPLDLDDPAVRGRTFEKTEAEAWKQDLHKQGYTEVYINKQGDFKTNKLLKQAFRDKRAGPDLVAIDHKNKKILVGDITAGAWSQTDIKPGGKRQLPHDIGAPEERRPHLEKTVEDAKQLARNLPDEYKDYTVVARDRYREDVRTQHSKEVVVKKGVAPSTGGSSKTPANKSAAPGQTAQKSKATAPPTTPAKPKATPTSAKPKTDTPRGGKGGGAKSPRSKSRGRGAGALAGDDVISIVGGILIQKKIMDPQNSEAFLRDLLSQQAEIEKQLQTQQAQITKMQQSGQPLFANIKVQVNYQTGPLNLEPGSPHYTFYLGVKLQNVKVSTEEIWQEEAPSQSLLKDIADEVLQKNIIIFTYSVPLPDPFVGKIELKETIDALKQAQAEADAQGCFIVTACYESQLAPEVILLNAFHEAMLRRSHLGRAFIEFYLETAPPIAHYLRQHDRLRTLVRQVILTPMVALVQWTAPWWKEEE
jgi:hypothetical protein